jgi:signal transduction histidine kinase
MDFRSGQRALQHGLGLLLCGVAGTLAWQHALWGLLTGSVLVVIWIGALSWSSAVRPRSAPPSPPVAAPDAGNAIALRLLLDAAPTALLGIENAGAHTLNRAARRLFATEDRIVPVPVELLDGRSTHLRYDGRSWRIDRVEVAGAGPVRTVAALIDVGQEERAAEARAMAELIQILGHELLNGLAPIVSLSESALAAAAVPGGDPALLTEILATLARRAEGLQRFTEGYRALARLPDPALRPVPVGELVSDLARLFAGRWPEVALATEVQEDLAWPLDRDQVSQAVWALLQNAAEASSVGPASNGRVALKIWVDAGLLIQVQDNGGGIPEEVAGHIFRPFHTNKPDGTGIGLSLARQIAHAHGGTLTLEPAPETRFRLWLPER